MRRDEIVAAIIRLLNLAAEDELKMIYQFALHLIK